MQTQLILSELKLPPNTVTNRYMYFQLCFLGLFFFYASYANYLTSQPATFDLAFPLLYACNFTSEKRQGEIINENVSTAVFPEEESRTSV